MAVRQRYNGTVRTLRLTSHVVVSPHHSLALINSNLFTSSNNCSMVCHRHAHI